MSPTNKLSDDDEPLLETQPPPNPPPSPWLPPTASILVSLTPAYESSDDDDAPYFTQPPALVNTVQTSTHPLSRKMFLDSVDPISNPTARDYTIPPSPPSIVIPDYVSSAIKHKLLNTWGCASPRPYQVKVIFHLMYRKVDTVYLIWKTGEGKSLVLQAMASMLKDVTISVVPLLGLGSDQQEKCNLSSKAVESYHLDEFQGSHAQLLMRHLRLYTWKEKTTIILFVSPQQMQKNSIWYAVLLDLASHGCI
jgi:superfamily II DNA helicase RecQ